MEESTFQKIATFQYSSEAIIFKGKLESEGIEVFMRDNNTVDSNPLYSNAVGGVKLFVQNNDFEKATDIFSNISQYSLDDNEKLRKCPKCGAEQIDMVTSIQDLKSFLVFLFSVFLVAIPFYSKHKYKCDNCKFEFK
ncbi:MAG: DUF2007 domain-containing protein [Bacteroidota bacterium]|jgi:predicted RNA-binding Zn-ribbon protein involved in translation (DUF1610 family)|uniref:putative signal transducing protein n=1 Tax=Flavobacterium sp. 11 TaxID=357523 RepID=UPI000C19D8DF|nr:DUF2007 domain-containing protein [Flavobacterium sp. 11]PIF61169.1 putative signal transducing protein [Flavobacterium sp. 11]